MKVSPRAVVVTLVLTAVVCRSAPVQAQQVSSLTLDAAIQAALAHNPDILRARAALASARAESVAAAVRLYNPELDADVARGGSSIWRGTDWTASIGLAQTLERPGKRPARLAVARALLEVASAQIREAERRVTLAIRREFARARILADQRAALTLSAHLDGEIADATVRRAHDGTVTPFVRRLTALEASRSQGELLHLAGEVHLTEVNVHTLLGSPDSGARHLEPSLDMQSRPLPPDSALITYALQHRADLDPLRAQLRVAEAQGILASREGQTDPTVGLALESNQQTLDGSVQGDPAITRGISSISDHGYAVRARISVPLPLHNWNQAGRARAEAALLVARADVVRREAAIRAEIFTAAIRASDTERLAAFSREAAQTARADLELVRDAYRGGRITLEDYLIDKGRLLDAIARSLNAAEQALTARADLESAVGAPLDDIVQGGSSR